MSNKTKALLFDMDGTIADLYAVDKWLEKLRAEDISPYKEAKPMYDMDTLSEIIKCLRHDGYKIIIVSWESMGASREYSKAIRKAKLQWLNSYGFPYDEVHIVKYGTPKSNFANSDVNILIDDNEEVRNAFLKSTRGKRKEVINAKMNIVKELVNLLLNNEF